jgi:two-component system chemotaxis response regulator CheB
LAIKPEIKTINTTRQAPPVNNSGTGDLEEELTRLIGDQTGIQIQGKEAFIQSRLTRRMRQLKIHSLSEYFEYVKSHRGKEIAELISLLTTHKTEFFREADHFNYLYHHVFPRLILSGQPIRLWSAASSTGEEVYSLAITFLEFLRTVVDLKGKIPNFQVIGTDIDPLSIKTAKEGIYPLKNVLNLQSSVIERYFEKGTGGLSGWVRIKEEVWRLCEFKVMNLLEDVVKFPIFNVVFSRNLFIYFFPDTIKIAATNIQAHLIDDGLLFVGFSEAIDTSNLPFVGLGNSIYKKVNKEAIVDHKIAGSAGIGTSLHFDKIRVLIVDDSPSIRKILKRILSADSDFIIVAEATNPIEAQKLLRENQVDVMTLDIQMPEMDGVTFLKKLQGIPHPPIVMLSSISGEEANQGLKCLELGAIDYLEKPSSLNLTTKAEDIRSVLKGAASSKVQSGLIHSAPVLIHYRGHSRHQEIVALGASAGGPTALKIVLQQFPHNSPPVVIVQHLPKFFTSAFAKKLSENCAIKVVEASDGTPLENGYAYIAPGGLQMRVVHKNGHLVIQVTNDSPMTQNCSTVNYLFQSLAALDENVKISAAILTGMGKDGAKGMKLLWKRGAHTVAQNEETCVVFGMPKAAIEAGAITEVLPLDQITTALFNGMASKQKARA